MNRRAACGGSPPSRRATRRAVRRRIRRRVGRHTGACPKICQTSGDEFMRVRGRASHGACHGLIVARSPPAKRFWPGSPRPAPPPPGMVRRGAGSSSNDVHRDDAGVEKVVHVEGAGEILDHRQNSDVSRRTVKAACSARPPQAPSNNSNGQTGADPPDPRRGTQTAVTLTEFALTEFADRATRPKCLPPPIFQHPPEDCTRPSALWLRAVAERGAGIRLLKETADSEAIRQLQSHHR